MDQFTVGRAAVGFQIPILELPTVNCTDARVGGYGILEHRSIGDTVAHLFEDKEDHKEEGALQLQNGNRAI